MFLDANLNRQLLGLFERSRVPHGVDGQGLIRYSAADEDRVDDDLICRIRDRAFPSWQILFCPDDWTDSYRDYMNSHGIPFVEELCNGEPWFLISRKYRPHMWKLVGRLSIRP